MSSHPLAGDYLPWLASQIRSDTDRTYDDLLGIMHETEFVWFVANDDNRIGDGLDLRVEFCHAQNIPLEQVGAFIDQDNPLPACSFLEVLIGLSRRLEFQAGGSPEDWAWTLMKNLELHKLSDPIGRRKADRAREILNTCIFRTYSPDGTGGFFPLTWPTEDQTNVEIWYQMPNYIDEHERKG